MSSIDAQLLVYVSHRSDCSIPQIEHKVVTKFEDLRPLGMIEPATRRHSGAWVDWITSKHETKSHFCAGDTCGDKFRWQLQGPQKPGVQVLMRSQQFFHEAVVTNEIGEQECWLT